MNLAFSLNPVALRTVPYSTLGMGFVFLPTKDLILTFSAVDTEEITTRTGFDTLFKDETTLASEARLTVRPFGLTGHQLISFTWSNKDFTSLSQDPRTLLSTILLGTSLNKESGSRAFMYNFDQYLFQEKQDPSQGFGIFGRFGISDGKANPIHQFYSFGFGGKAPVSLWASIMMTNRFSRISFALFRVTVFLWRWLECLPRYPKPRFLNA